MDATPSPDDLLLIDEVAAITRRSVDTLRWLRHKGRGLPASAWVGASCSAAVRSWTGSRRRSASRSVLRAAVARARPPDTQLIPRTT